MTPKKKNKFLKFLEISYSSLFATANTEIRQEAASVARCSVSRFPLLQAGAFDRLAFDDILFKQTSTYLLLTSAGLRLFSSAKVILAVSQGPYGLVDSRASPFFSRHFRSIAKGFPSRVSHT